MKISIITVTYNSESFIQHCINSVLSQTYKDVEYIIIDGGSKDETLNIVRSYKNVTFYSEPDDGIYDAINKGIRKATGDIIGLLNSDDFFADNDVLNRIHSAFDEDKTIKAVFADVQFVEKENIDKAVRYYSSKWFKPYMFKFGFQPAHPTFYARKELFEENHLYRIDLKIAGDFEFMLRFLLVKGIKYKYINDLWIKMRVGGASTSGIKSMLRINSEIIRACRSNNVYTNKLMVYSKYLMKWWGFIHKNK